MALNRIAERIVPTSRTAVFGSFLLAAVVATALVSPGEARAVLLNEPADCNAIGAERVCTGVPQDVGVLDTLSTVSDTGPGGDPLFTVSATETTIVLTFSEFATGNALDGTGFALTGLQSIPDLVPGDLDVTFLGDWGIDNEDIPILSPFVTEDLASVQWTSLAGGDPSGGAVARINLQFVPEPGTALLMGLGLAGLGVVGRPKRAQSEGTA